jgi:hypothetical protein
MINTEPHPPRESVSDETDAIVAAGPRGAVVLASIATACVVALWFAFYCFVFLPRGALQ